METFFITLENHKTTALVVALFVYIIVSKIKDKE
jgi:hypothetical protein